MRVLSILAIRLPENIEKRLARLAQVTGRTKTFYAREAILQHLADLEDQYIALYRLEHPEERISHTDMEKMIGLSNGWGPL